MSLGTRRFLAGIVLLLTGLLVWHYITDAQFTALLQLILAPFTALR